MCDTSLIPHNQPHLKVISSFIQITINTIWKSLGIQINQLQLFQIFGYWVNVIWYNMQLFYNTQVWQFMINSSKWLTILSFNCVMMANWSRNYCFALKWALKNNCMHVANHEWLKFWKRNYFQPPNGSNFGCLNFS